MKSKNVKSFEEFNENDKLSNLSDKVFEKMGTPNIITDIINKYSKSIEDCLNNQTNLSININDTNIIADIFIKFIISDNYKGGVDYNNCINSGFKKCNITINYLKNYDISNVLKTLSHELTHIYELYKVRNILNTTKWSWQNALNKTKKQDDYGLIRYLRDIIYLSLPQELNARVSSIYLYLHTHCDGSYNKEDMIKTLKSTKEWDNYINLMDFDPYKLTNGLIGYYKNNLDLLFTMVNELNSNIGILMKINNSNELYSYLSKLNNGIKKSASKYKVKLFKVLNRVHTELQTKDESIYEEPDDVSYEKYLKKYNNRDLIIDELFEYKIYIDNFNSNKVEK